MKFEHPEFGWFSVVDKPTVKQALTYKGAVGAAISPDGVVDYNRFWLGSKGLIDEWNVKHIADYRKLDLSDEVDFNVVNIIVWVCVVVAGFMTDLETIPKNS